MKKLLLLVIGVLIISCSSDDNNCDCTFSSELGIWIPNELSKKYTLAELNQNLSEQQKQDINKDCEKKCE